MYERARDYKNKLKKVDIVQTKLECTSKLSWVTFTRCCMFKQTGQFPNFIILKDMYCYGIKTNYFVIVDMKL